MAMIFSDGCQAMCRIFLVKSRLSTPTSPRRRLPPVYTRLVRRTARGLLLSRHASRVTPRPVSLSNIRKKLLYAPVMMTLRRGEERRGEERRGEEDIMRCHADGKKSEGSGKGEEVGKRKNKIEGTGVDLMSVSSSVTLI